MEDVNDSHHADYDNQKPEVKSISASGTNKTDEEILFLSQRRQNE
jgi:hypothetical protein